jgi:hypothetical protein
VRKPRFLSRVSVVLLWVLAAKLLGALVGVLWLVVLPVATFIVMWAVIIAVVGYIALQVLASMADNRTPEQKAADAQAKKDAEDAAKAEAQAARLALCHELMKIDRPWEDLPDREEIYDTEGTLVGTRVKGKDSYFKVLDGEGKVLGEARVEFKKANLVRAYDELKVFDTADKSGEPVVFLSQAQYGNQHVSYQGDPGLFDSAAKKVTSELDADKEGLYVRETDKVSGESTTSRRVGETWGNPAHTETTKEKK